MPSTTDHTTTESQASVVFTPALVERTGDIGEVLVELMNNQTRRIKAELQEEFKNKLPPKALSRILGSFVSLEGTKQPRAIEELQFPELPKQVVVTAVNKLVDARLLRESEDGVYELVHDTLADHLFQTRDQDDVAVDVAVKMVTDAYFFKDKTNRLLSSAELEQLEKHREVIRATNRLNEEEWKFVEKSRKRARRRTLAQLAVFSMVLAVAIFMSVQVATINNKNAEIEKNRSALELTAMDLRRTQKHTIATAQALQNSESDRTNAFDSLFTVFSDPEIAKANRILVSQLVNDYLSEYSIFPFYTFKNKSHEAIDDIIVGDSLEFIATSAHESPLVSFLDSVLINIKQGKVGHLYDPSEYKRYRPVRNMALQRQGNEQFLYTAHGDGKIWKWRPGSKSAPDSIYHFQGRDTLIRDMAIAGNFLLVGVDSVVYEIDLRRRKRVARHILGFSDAVKLLVAHPREADKFAVVKENSNRILMCRTNSINTIVDSFIQDLSVVTSFAFSPDGRKMIAGYEEGNIARMWDIRRRDIHTIFRGHESLISSIAFAPDGRTIITGGWDQMGILWTDKGDVIKRLVGHQQRINSVSYTKNNFAVTCSADGVFNIWNLNPLSQDQVYCPARVRAMAVSDQQSQIAYSVYGEHGIVYLWDPIAQKRDTIRQPLQYRGDKAADIVALRYSDDGSQLSIAAQNWLTTLVDVKTGKLVQEYRGGYKGLPITPSIVATDVSDRYLLLADKEKKQVVLHDRKDPSKFLQLKHPGRIFAAKFSPDNSRVLTGCEDGNAYLWDISKAVPTYRLLKGHAARVIALDFSPDGKYILTGSYDNSALLYELDRNVKGVLIPLFSLEGITATFKGHSANINDVSFSNNSGTNGIYRFVTGSSDRTAKYWKLSNGNLEEVPSVMRHLGEIVAADFLPGDSLIVTASYDESIQVWQAEDLGQLIRARRRMQ